MVHLVLMWQVAGGGEEEKGRILRGNSYRQAN